MNQKQSPRDEAAAESGLNSAMDTGGNGKSVTHSVSRSARGPQPSGSSTAARLNAQSDASDDPGSDRVGEPAAESGQPDGVPGKALPESETTDPDSSPAASEISQDAEGPTAHVVLYQPEIPQNTGNIGRTCVATGAKLWIVRPAAFRIDDAKLRRAGLDYWQHLEVGDAINWQDLLDQLGDRRLFFFSRFAKRTIWDVEFQRGDAFIFGRESSGLPESILDPNDERALRLPTSQFVRSLNLATTAGIVLYEQQRQMSSSTPKRERPSATT